MSPASFREWLQPERFDRIVVVAPHPDDEIFGCAGLLVLAQAARVPLDLIIATDGEACYPELAEGERARLASLRPQESLLACRALGLECVPVFFGLDDGALAEGEGVLIQELGARVSDRSLLVVTDPADRHPDHEALGRAACMVACQHGCELLFYQVWARIHGRSVQEDAQQVSLVPGADLACRKHAAARCFLTQIDSYKGAGPVIGAEIFGALVRGEEVYLPWRP